MENAPAQRPPRRLVALRRPALWGGAAVAALLLAWVVAHEAVDRPARRKELRNRAALALTSRLPRVVLGDEASIDWLFRAQVGPLVIPADAPGAPPLLSVQRVRVRLSWRALLSGRVEPSTITLLDVRMAPGPGGSELLSLVAQLRAARPGSKKASGGAPPPEGEPRGPDPVLYLRGATVLLPLHGQTMESGPYDLRLERRRDGAHETVLAELGLPGGGSLEGALRRLRPEAMPAGKSAPRGRERAGQGPEGGGALRPPGGAPGLGPAPAPPEPATWTLTARLAATTRDLPEPLRHRAVQATGGSLKLSAEAEGTASGGRITLRGEVDGLVLRGEPLGPEPVGPLDLGGEALLEASLPGPKVVLRRSTLRPAGPLEVEASGHATLAGDFPFELGLTVPPVDYGALLAALPRALAPGPEAPRPAGTVGGRLSLSGPLRAPQAWTVQAEVDLSGMREAARRGPPSRLRGQFLAQPRGEEGPVFLLGPENPDFVPIAQLPDHVVRAVTTSEDAGFFGHQGFDFAELRNALVEGARAGKLGRGGSTITQQLAKNLFLSRDRTISRKAREALLTLALEGTLPKARLLEIYLNLIEWGPRLHGLGPAARHYLGKDARSLSPREACFLATLIPSPVRSHAALSAGAPSGRWNERIDDLLRKLAAVGVLNEASLARELAAPLALATWIPRSPTAEVAAPAPDEGDATADGADGPPGGGSAGGAPAGAPASAPTEPSAPESAPATTAAPPAPPAQADRPAAEGTPGTPPPP